MGATTSKKKQSVITLSDTIEKYTESSNPVVCRNVAIIRDTANCNIRGGNQMCAAEGALEILRDPGVIKSVKETVTNKTTKEARKGLRTIGDIIKDQAKNFPPKDKADVDRFLGSGASFLALPLGTRDVTESVSASVACDSMTRMTTKCNQAVHALNKATIDGTICSKDEYMDHISNFGEQISGVSSLAQCSLGEGDWKNVVGDVDQRGVQFLAAVKELAREWVPKGVEPFLSIYYACFIASVILVVGWSASAHKSPLSPFIKLLTIITVVVSAYVWPGRMAVRYGSSPFSKPTTHATIGGDWVCNKEAMEKFFISPLGRPYFDKETGDLKHYGYNGCGIYSGQCDDPSLKQDLQKWTGINNACLQIPDGITKSCDTQSLFDAIISTSNVPHCKKCEGKYGLYDAEIDCEQVSDIPPDVYGGFGNSFQSNGTVKTVNCPKDDKACIRDRIKYGEVSPGECISGEYHEQKRELVKLYMQCKTLKDLAKKPTDEIGEMCPPKPSDYLKCNDDGKCNYSEGSHRKNCSNDIEGCANPGYQQDKYYVDAINMRCEMELSLNERRGNITVVITVLVYFLIVPFLILMFLFRWFKNGRIQPIPLPVFVTSMLLTIPMLIVMLPPLGVVQVGNKMGIYEDGYLPFNGEGAFDFLRTLAPMALCLFLAIVFVPLVYLRGKLSDA